MSDPLTNMFIRVSASCYWLVPCSSDNVVCFLAAGSGVWPVLWGKNLYGRLSLGPLVGELDGSNWSFVEMSGLGPVFDRPSDGSVYGAFDASEPSEGELSGLRRSARGDGDESSRPCPSPA